MARVAVTGSSKALPGSDTVFNGAADTGAWTAGPVTEVGYPTLSSGGAQVVHQASCTFTFAGTKGAGPPVPVTGTSAITLEPTATTLQGGQSHVLLDGDRTTDSFGNSVAVVVPSSSKLVSGG